MRPYSLSAAILLLVIAWALPSAADDQRIYACNYTVSLTMDKANFIVTQQARVRDGSNIPIDAQDVRLRMNFSAAGDERVLIELVLLERTDSGWAEIYPEPPSFEIAHGEPAEFSHEDDIAEIDVALIVSVASD